MIEFSGSIQTKRFLGSTSILAMLAVASFTITANAQDQDEDDTVEEITVTGFRGSLASAVDVKRRADTVVEAISAEDIGRLPDVSIAEALARLPGITSQRTSGQSSAINVRGLPQNLVFTTLNGREQVTPNGARAIEFEQFPSELISSVEVYKSPKAELLEGGVAGTVNFNTIRPLSKDETIFNVNARLSLNDRAGQIFGANEFGYRVSAAYVDQFADGKVGLSIGYARLEQPDVAVRFAQFDFTGGAQDFNGDGTNDSPSFGFETTEDGGNETRDGVIATLQFKPTDNFSLDFDGYYSRFESESFRRGVRVTGPQEVNSGNTQVENPIVADNALIGGAFSRNVGAPTVDGGGFGLTAAGINDDLSDTDELVSIGSKAEWTNERWTVTGDFTYSRADSQFVNEVSASLPLSSLDRGVAGVSNSSPNTPVLNDNLNIVLNTNGISLPSVNFSQDFTNVGQVFLSRFGVFPTENEDELFAFAGAVEYEAEWGIIKSIEVGARYSEREASQFREAIDFGNDAGFFQFAANLFTPISLVGDASTVECFSGEFADNGFPCFLAIENPRALVEAQIGPVVADQSQGFTLDQSFTVNEDVFSAFAQVNLEGSFGDTPFTGNIGLRVVNTDQSSQAQSAINNGIPATGIEFTEFLPSANFVFEVTENDYVRLGASRAFSRPPIFELGAGFSVGFDSITNLISVSGSGNPALLPTLANQFDFSYEHYFENGGIFSAAFFYKDLETFVANDGAQGIDFDGLDFENLLASEQFDAFIAAGSPTIGNANGVANGEGGNVWGIEVGTSIPFDVFADSLKNFGFTGSYAYTESSVTFTSGLSGTSLTADLPGLSNSVLNSTFYYENAAGFGARVSGRYRSSFISPQLGIDTLLPNTTEELIIDFQASYAFSEESDLSGLTLLFQATNLTDEPTTTFFGTESRTGTIQNFGRQFFLGASYSF
jgi:TonB-dependent receptor